MGIGKVKIFLSSRDVPHVSNNLCEHAKVNLDKNECVKQDVEKCIRRRVHKFGGWDVHQKNRAINLLCEKSGGIFLWASLAIKTLRSFSTGLNSEVFLRQLPSELKAVYGKMLCDIQSGEGSEGVLKMIQIVALALRPLTFG